MPPTQPVSKYIEIARNLWNFLDHVRSRKRLSIFLCGGAEKHQVLLRESVAMYFRSTRSKYSYRAYFPEHLFMDVLHGHHRVDLLGLESQLADSVHAIAILMDSPGTMTELGAFANHEKLSHKLIVFVDPRHRRRKSFIALGPLRHLEKHNIGKVVYIPLQQESARAIADTTQSFARQTALVSKLAPEPSLLNPVIAHEFYLSLIFLFTPLADDTLRHLAVALFAANDHRIRIIADAIISTLIRDGLVRRSPAGLETTTRGRDELFDEFTTYGLRFLQRKTLTQLRFRVLNLLYRGRNRIQRGTATTWSTR